MFKDINKSGIFASIFGILICVFLNCIFKNDDSVTGPPAAGKKLEAFYGKWDIKAYQKNPLFAYYIFTDSMVFAKAAWYYDSVVVVKTLRGDWYISQLKENFSNLVLDCTFYDSTFYSNGDSIIGKFKNSDTGSIQFDVFYMLSGTNQLLLPIIDSKEHSSLYVLDTSFHLNSTGSIEDRQNSAPVFSNINKQDTIIAGTSVSIQLNVSDPDYEPIKLSIVKGLQGGTLNQRKIFTWQSEKSDTGLTTIIFSATDGNVAVFDTFTIMVSAKKNLYPPVNYIGPFYSVASGTRLSLPFVVSDPDSDSVVVTIKSGPDSAKILPDSNSDSSLLSWKTTTQDSGVHVLIMSASDGAHIIIDTIEIYV
jgi:hypothetical protein